MTAAEWKHLESLTDDDIDTSDIPEVTEEIFQRGTWRNREPVSVTLPLDPIVLAWFRRRGDDWEGDVNAALREYAIAHLGDETA